MSTSSEIQTVGCLSSPNIAPYTPRQRLAFAVLAIDGMLEHCLDQTQCVDVGQDQVAEFKHLDRLVHPKSRMPDIGTALGVTMIYRDRRLPVGRLAQNVDFSDRFSSPDGGLLFCRTSKSALHKATAASFKKPEVEFSDRNFKIAIELTRLAFSMFKGVDSLA